MATVRREALGSDAVASYGLQAHDGAAAEGTGEMMKLICAAFMVSTASAEADRIWIFEPDYPAALVQQGKAGLVEVALVFDHDGRLSSCTVLKSSGTALLDATTCRILHRRARVKAGEPRAQTYRHRWVPPSSR